ncbi:MAG TPA: molecular chaperone HscC [Rhizomicrobium sp.]|jgi:molecular chaperone HscC
MIIGIDLGTTNSLAAVWRDGEAVLIPNALGQFLTPSVVGEADDGSILVGQAARDRLITHPGSATAAFKRYMGTTRQVSVGRKSYRPEELSALVLRSLKADAEAFLGGEVTEAIITVPAYFNDAQRKATKAAGQLAGLKVDRLLTEPTAAALAYGFATGDEESTVLVVDLGGGTLDVSLLHSFEGIMEVKATAGDIWLGGEDFTDVIVQGFLAEAGKAAGLADVALDTQVYATLRRQAEIAKRTLSEAGEAKVEFNYNGKPITWGLTRERYEQMAEPLLAKVRLPLDRALRDARIAPDEIMRIVFAGGATRMPMFRRMVSRLFRQLPVQHINPDEVVGRGAAVRVGLLEKSKGLEEHVLTDVSPFTLGIGISSDESGVVLHGLYLPIIERNTVIPTSRSHIVQTMSNQQRQVHVKIYQGEARMVSDNVFLGELTIDVPPAPAGEEKLDVRFSYDTSGLLDVDVTVLSTKRQMNLVIEGNPGVLTAAEVAERLAKLGKLKIHPRDEAQNIAVVSRAKRVFEEHLGLMRTRIGEMLDGFMAIVEGQDADRIREAREVLTKFLDSVDRDILV